MRLLGLYLLLAVPLLAAPWAGGLVLERSARAAGRVLGALLPTRASGAEGAPGGQAPPSRPPSPADPTEGRARHDRPATALSGAASRPGGRRPAGQGEARASAPRGIFVPSKTVLRLAASGARPSGRYVAATKARPAGLALSGVTALGLGARDGDVLTQVDGRPVRAVVDVVQTVLAARARRATTVSGWAYRGGRPYPIVVEMPYPEPSRSSAAIRAASSRAAGASSP